MPTDNIIEVLDENEEVIAKKLRDINEAEEPDKDILNFESEESVGPAFGSDEDGDDVMDNGIKNQVDP